MDGRMTPTINLTCDFLAPAPLGAWVEGRGELVRATRNLLFAQGHATADGALALRANGIFKIASENSTKSGDIAPYRLFDFDSAG
jgi:acyl-coenzyme A thioesterase PaaI-like protein